MVERIRARQSATFLFGAQARAGVWPEEGGVNGKIVINGIVWQEKRVHCGAVTQKYIYSCLPSSSTAMTAAPLLSNTCTTVAKPFLAAM